LDPGSRTIRKGRNPPGGKNRLNPVASLGSDRGLVATIEKALPRDSPRRFAGKKKGEKVENQANFLGKKKGWIGPGRSSGFSPCKL